MCGNFSVNAMLEILLLLVLYWNSCQGEWGWRGSGFLVIGTSCLPPPHTFRTTPSYTTSYYCHFRNQPSYVGSLMGVKPHHVSPLADPDTTILCNSGGQKVAFNFLPLFHCRNYLAFPKHTRSVLTPYWFLCWHSWESASTLPCRRSVRAPSNQDHAYIELLTGKENCSTGGHLTVTCAVIRNVCMCKQVVLTTVSPPPTSLY